MRADVEDRRRRLEALRDKLAVAMESCGENMLPQLAGQYRATLADLAALAVDDEPEVKSTRDQLKERREQKQESARAGASGRVAGAAAASDAKPKGRQHRA